MKCFDGGEPEDLFSGCPYYFPNGGNPAFGIQNDEHVKAALSKTTLKISRDSKLKVVSDFLFPDFHALVSEIEFEEERRSSCWRLEFEVSVRDETEVRGQWFVESYPPLEHKAWNQRARGLQRAINLIQCELVLDE